MISCSHSGDRLRVDVSNIGIPPVRIHRYELALFRIPDSAMQDGLERIRPEFRFFLDTDLSDTARLNQLRYYLASYRTQEFYRESLKRYPGTDLLEEQFTGAFRHYRFYFPGNTVPRIYTYISGGDYDYPVQFADSVLLIALDAYLGADFTPYRADGLPFYRIRRTGPGFILPDAMKAIAEGLYPARYAGTTLLEQMVAAGKKIWFAEAMIPEYPPQFLLGYTPEQMDWVTENESHVWAALIENQMLYSASGQTGRTFMADGPFTSEFGSESPSRLGVFIGWRIVKHYMENHPDVTIDELMTEADAQKILTGSRYKPGK
jgi:hypothetical protein